MHDESSEPHRDTPDPRELLEASPDIVFACDADGALLWLSRAFEVLTGRVAAEQIGRHWSTLVAPYQARHTARLFVRQSRRRTPVVEVALPLLAREGREAWVAARVSLRERPEGAVIFVGTARALESGVEDAGAATPRTTTAGPAGAAAAVESVPGPEPESAAIAPAPRPRGGLARAFQFLRRGSRSTAAAATAATPAEPAAGEPGALLRRLEQVTAERDEARATAEAKAELLAAMTHEICTPINGMMGMGHLLLETDLDRDQRGMLEVLLHSGETLLDLVNDTLDFSRVGAGRLELERLPFDLRVTASEAAALLAPVANEKGLGFDFDVHHEVPSRLWGDPGRLRQILLNLGGNAVRSTAQGRVRLAIARLREDERDVTLRCSIRDTGAGMNDEQRARLVGAFRQADAGSVRRSGGAGLGLAISSRLVTLMGGTVGVESVPGEGSTFWFDVTLEKQREAPAAQEPAPSRVGLAGLRVLVVEPSVAMRRSFTAKLEAWGCRVEQAENAEVGLVMLQEAAEAGDPFRFALVERQLPGMNGEEMGAAIRADGACDRTLTVLVTAAGSRGDAARARARGFSAYLSKPLEWNALSTMLAEVLARLEQTPAGETPELVTLHSMAEARRSRLRILLVEDAAVGQLVTQWTLKRLGYGLETVTTMRAALEAWERGPFDLVLTDLQLPDGDGCALARALRGRDGAGRRVPLVAMSTAGDPAELERCLAAGIDEHLMKPVDLGLLCRVIETLTTVPAQAPGPAPPAPAAGTAATPAVDDTPLLREIEAAEADISGVRRRDDGPGDAANGGVESELGTAPRGFTGTHAAEVLAAEQALFEAETAGGGAGADPGPAPDPAAWTPAALSSADVLPLDAGEPGGEAAGDVPRPALDLARLDGTSMGIPVLREQLLDTFLGEVRPRLEQLLQALNARDARRVEFEAHGLKGMCATLGAMGCTDVFAELERVGRERTLEQAGPLIKRAYLEVTRTERFITTMERMAA